MFCDRPRSPLRPVKADYDAEKCSFLPSSWGHSGLSLFFDLDERVMVALKK